LGRVSPLSSAKLFSERVRFCGQSCHWQSAAKLSCQWKVRNVAARRRRDQLFLQDAGLEWPLAGVERHQALFIRRLGAITTATHAHRARIGVLDVTDLDAETIDLDLSICRETPAAVGANGKIPLR
jgi:hypothetical protein